MSLLLLSNTNFSITLNSTALVERKEKEQLSTFYYTFNQNKKVLTKQSKNQKLLRVTHVTPKRSIGKRESNGNWTIVNPYGYIGTYQFGRAALDATGYKHITIREFRKNPSIWPPEEQEKAMSKLLSLNKKVLTSYIAKFEGDTINGIVITESGLLAAAHLAGAGGVIKYLDSGGRHDPFDKNGTHLSTYLREFAN